MNSLKENDSIRGGKKTLVRDALTKGPASNILVNI